MTTTAQSTLSRPPPPPKPSHLSSAFTGTLNSEALHAYIKAQKTGDSVYGTFTGKDTIQPQSSSITSSAHSGAQSLRNLYDPPVQTRHIDFNAEIAIDGSGATDGIAEEVGDRRTFIATSPFPQQDPAQVDSDDQEEDDDDADTTGAHSRYVSMASMASTSTLRQSDRDTFTTAEEGEGDGDGGPWEDIARNNGAASSLPRNQRFSALSIGTSHGRDDSTATLKAADTNTQQVSPPSPDDAPWEEETPKDPLASPYSQNSPGERSREPSVLVAGEGGFLRQRDGSLFERAGIARERTPEEPVSEEIETLAPVVPLSITGPPPVRPESIAVDLDEIIKVEQETDEEDAEEEAEAEQSLTVNTTVKDPVVDPPSLPASVPLPRGRPARALYDFQGEPSFNELTLTAGQCFEVLNEELAGGWSLAVVREATDARRGLVPRGWYCYIQDFTMSPAHAPDSQRNSRARLEAPSSPSPSKRPSSSQSGAMWPEALPYTISGPSEPLAVSPSTSRAIVGLDISDIVPARASIAGSGSSSAGRAERALSLVRGGDEATPRNSKVASRSSMASAASARRLEGGVPMSSSGSGTSLLVQAIEELGEGKTGETQLQRPDSEVSYDSELGNGNSSQVYSSQPSATTGGSSATTTVSGPGAMPASSVPSAGWRATLFGGRSLNRFSSFVTSGVEDYIISGPAPMEDREEGESEADAEALTTQQSKASKGYGLFSWAGWRSSSSGIAEEEDEMAYEADRHYVVSGAAGPRWKSKATPFYVSVHSPEKRTKLNGMQEYTVFNVTSIFPASEDGAESSDSQHLPRLPRDPTLPPEPAGTSLAVIRRFNQFVWLSDILHARYPLLALPSLPSKQYAGRFAADFIETRRADLDLWLGSLVRHPVLRYAEALNFFLSCDDEGEWKKRALKLAEPLKVVPREVRRGGSSSVSLASLESTSSRFRMQPAEAGQKPLSGPPAFFANTYHPEFNVDATDAALEARAMERHARMYERAMVGGAMGEKGGSSGLTGGVMGSWRGLREGVAGSGARYRDLSLSLLRLITGKGLVAPGTSSAHASEPRVGGTLNSHTLQGHLQHGPPMGNVGRRGDSGATNDSGAWCWRDGCTECVALSNALQNTAEALQAVADEYDDHARGTLMRFHERVKGLARPHALYANLLETHNVTLTKYLSATGESDPLTDDISAPQPSAPEIALLSEHIAARCETVLNVTMAELDRAHSERVQDWSSLARGFLDGQIAHYEAVLTTLRDARSAYDDDVFPGLAERDPVLPSVYETEISVGGAGSGRPPPIPPLPMPSNPVLSAGVAASALRPVSLAGEVLSEHLFGGTNNAPTTQITSSYYNHLQHAVNGSAGREY